MRIGYNAVVGKPALLQRIACKNCMQQLHMKPLLNTRMQIADWILLGKTCETA